ncbi:MAG TPA: MFS transporter [Lacunisphaera sp.]|nr:MFS transporter [Lacunisphaera sp.]
MEPSSPTSSWRVWSWVPSLYFSQGVPNAVAASLSVVMFKNLGMSNAEIALYTSAFYLPWVIKPLWSPVVELTGAKRRWVVVMQAILALVLAALAMVIPSPDFRWLTLVLLWVMAFCSATHDIAADGFYLLALPAHQQAAFVGVRSTFFRLSSIAVKGGLVGLAGLVIAHIGGIGRAWGIIFAVLAGWFALSTAYHAWALPRPDTDVPAGRGDRERPGALEVFTSFLAKPGIGVILSFLLLYRLAEALALKLVEPFLLDPRAVGGLGLTNEQLGLANGTVGVISLLAGGLLGGWLISRYGLKRMLWPLICAMHAPLVVFLVLAWARPESLAQICAALAIEQFGYGLGFTAYMVYMMSVAAGPHQTAHYAICTGFMAAGLLLPGMVAGWLQEQLGYVNFFLCACLATLPSFVAVAMVKVDPAYGRKATPASPAR